MFSSSSSPLDCDHCPPFLLYFQWAPPGGHRQVPFPELRGEQRVLALGAVANGRASLVSAFDKDNIPCLAVELRQTELADMEEEEEDSQDLVEPETILPDVLGLLGDIHTFVALVLHILYYLPPDLGEAISIVAFHTRFVRFIGEYLNATTDEVDLLQYASCNPSFLSLIKFSSKALLALRSHRNALAHRAEEEHLSFDVFHSLSDAQVSLRLVLGYAGTSLNSDRVAMDDLKNSAMALMARAVELVSRHHPIGALLHGTPAIWRQHIPALAGISAQIQGARETRRETVRALPLSPISSLLR